jgi:hypothetical protein
MMYREYFLAFLDSNPRKNEMWQAPQLDWSTWLGSPMWYDGGFYVNRTLEERNEHDRRTQRRS